MIYFPPLVDMTLVLCALASLFPITAASSRCHCATERSFRLPFPNNKSQTEWKIALEWSYYSWETRWFILMDFHGILRCSFLTTLSSLGCCEQTNENFCSIEGNEWYYCRKEFSISPRISQPTSSFSVFSMFYWNSNCQKSSNKTLNLPCFGRDLHQFLDFKYS